MPRAKLTAASVSRMKPPATGQVDYFDATMPAFGVRLSYAGTRTFFLMARWQGKMTRFNLGRAKTDPEGEGLTLAEARQKAGEWQDLIGAGKDPRTPKAPQTPAMAVPDPSQDLWESIADRFIRQYAKPRNRSWKEAERVLAKDVTPHWRGRRIQDIAKRDVIALTDALAESGRAALANRVLQHIKRVMSWCVEKDILEDSPARTVKAPAPKVARDRFLSDDEIKVFWQGADKMGWPWSVPLKLLLLTGQRRSEVVEMQWRELSDLDGDNPTWIIPAARSKNGNEHAVPLAPMVVDLLRTVPRVQGSAFLFSTTGKTPLSGISKCKKRLDGYMDAIQAEAGGEPMEPWTLHDLRRTFASGAGGIGVRLEVIERCLNHTSGSFRGIVKTYQRYEHGPEKRAALTAWAAHVLSLVEGRDETNVVPLTVEAAT